MQESRGAPNGLIAQAANRFPPKADREASGVLSGAQRHTHFLDSPRVAASLARSDFRFAELRHKLTVFLVLPPNRMDAYSRWLRLLVSEALQDIASASPLSAPAAQPERGPRLRTPTLFLLDEFAALGRLSQPLTTLGPSCGDATARSFR